MQAIYEGKATFNVTEHFSSKDNALYLYSLKVSVQPNNQQISKAGLRRNQ